MIQSGHTVSEQHKTETDRTQPVAQLHIIAKRMQTILNTLNRTYRLVKILSNPQIYEYLESRADVNREGEYGMKTAMQADRFGAKDAFFHKHYIVHVVN